MTNLATHITVAIAAVIAVDRQLVKLLAACRGWGQ